MTKPTFTALLARARSLGLTVVEDHVGDQLGYWLEDPVTGEGPWEDDNFSTSLEELAGKLDTLAAARSQGGA